jgi:hypothetical protein
MHVYYCLATHRIFDITAYIHSYSEIGSVVTDGVPYYSYILYTSYIYILYIHTTSSSVVSVVAAAISHSFLFVVLQNDHYRGINL